MAAVAAAAASKAAAATTTTTEATTTTATTTARTELYQSPAALETAGTVDAPKALATATSAAAAAAASSSPPTAATAFATTRLHLPDSPFLREETVERSLDAISRGGRQKRTRFGVKLRLPI